MNKMYFPNRQKPVVYSINDQGCFISNLAKDKDGYCRIKIKGKGHRLHRLSYFKHNGYLIECIVVRHLCKNPSCFNPDHLDCGTQKDNMIDRKKDGNNPVGVKNGRSKLTAFDVKNIKQLLKSNSCYWVAKKYTVDYKTIKDIQTGKNWSHIK